VKRRSAEAVTHRNSRAHPVSCHPGSHRAHRPPAGGRHSGKPSSTPAGACHAWDPSRTTRGAASRRGKPRAFGGGRNAAGWPAPGHIGAPSKLSDAPSKAARRLPAGPRRLPKAAEAASKGLQSLLQLSATGRRAADPTSPIRSGRMRTRRKPRRVGLQEPHPSRSKKSRAKRASKAEPKDSDVERRLPFCRCAPQSLIRPRVRPRGWAIVVALVAV